MKDAMDVFKRSLIDRGGELIASDAKAVLWAIRMPVAEEKPTRLAMLRFHLRKLFTFSRRRKALITKPLSEWFRFTYFVTKEQPQEVVRLCKEVNADGTDIQAEVVFVPMTPK